eukprot:456426-Alexandrium_andersonii.AAC.1
MACAEGVEACVRGARLDDDDLPLEPVRHGREAGSVNPAAVTADGRDPFREVGGRIARLHVPRGRVVRRPVRLVQGAMGRVLHMVLHDDPDALAELGGLAKELGPLRRRGHRRLVARGGLGHAEAVPRAVAAPAAVQEAQGGKVRQSAQGTRSRAVESRGKLRGA